MAKRKTIDFPFYIYLNYFLVQNKKKIYKEFKKPTKKFLNHNNPAVNSSAWLRLPQFEALEMYVFLKEFLNNNHLFEIFKEWANKEGAFEGRETIGINKQGQGELFGPSEFTSEDPTVFQQVFQQIESFRQIYPNYIFALTMGLGKTVLMATSIFYEFLLANKYPQDERFCHNALVFAPDKTVLQSLKEIVTLDKSKVVPPQYVNWLEAHLKFHFLDDTGLSLNAIDDSRFNIIISNTQKVILKKQHKEESPVQNLFNDNVATHVAKTIGHEDLYDFDIGDETQLRTNQKFEKLKRLPQLGIYLDEAHHAFGSKLEKDFLSKTATSLRVTINELAHALKTSGSKVVGCYNYTGTPYIKNRLLPEVVYEYGLRRAINKEYLKSVRVEGLKNITTQTKLFIEQAVADFLDKYNGKRFEGMVPKFAFFCSTINELQNEFKPILEEVLSEHGIPSTRILVNVGDPKLTTNDDLREFIRLDTPGSEKQFILLVGKGKEGWNCRSLFGVGLHRQPKSKIFVLQATMRCLRGIGESQEEAIVYLSEENRGILSKELEENFNLSIEDLNPNKGNKRRVQIKLVPPPVKVKLKRIKNLYQLTENDLFDSVDLKLSEVDLDHYKVEQITSDIKDLTQKKKVQDLTQKKETIEYSEITIVAEIARYLQEKSCLEIRKTLSESKEGFQKILEVINQHNELLYDWLVPNLFNTYYKVEPFTREESEEIELVKPPKERGYYEVTAAEDKIISLNEPRFEPYGSKSFHLDNYCFDSDPEKQMFMNLLKDERFEKVWFTGMLTHGQSDFLIRYIDPDSNSLRSYYPDFLVKVNSENDKYIIVEVKGDNKIEDAIVRAKAESAEQIANASEMKYLMIKGSEASKDLLIE